MGGNPPIGGPEQCLDDEGNSSKTIESTLATSLITQCQCYFSGFIYCFEASVVKTFLHDSKYCLSPETSTEYCMIQWTCRSRMYCCSKTFKQRKQMGCGGSCSARINPTKSETSPEKSSGFTTKKFLSELITVQTAFVMPEAETPPVKHQTETGNEVIPLHKSETYSIQESSDSDKSPRTSRANYAERYHPSNVTEESDVQGSVSNTNLPNEAD